MYGEIPDVTHYIESERHWCPLSESYTGVDSLLSALLEGWTLHRHVYRHETLRRLTRKIVIYYFELARDDAVVTMAVINNPRIHRVIDEYGLRVITNTVLETTERDTVEARRILPQEELTETVEAPAVITPTHSAEGKDSSQHSQQVAFAS